MNKLKSYNSFCVIVLAVLLGVAGAGFAQAGDNQASTLPGTAIEKKNIDDVVGLPEFNGTGISTSPAEDVSVSDDDLPSLKPPTVRDSQIVPAPPAKPAEKKSPVAAPEKAKPTTQPAQPAVVKKPAAATKPAKTKPVVKKTAKKPADKTPEPIKTAPAKPKPIKPAEPQTEDEKLQSMVLKLQMENAKMMAELTKGKKANSSLTTALRESRMHASDLESELRRKEIELKIRDEKAVLEKLKATASTQPAKTANVLQQENNILALQLRLSRIDEPQRTKEMLEQIGAISRQRDVLEDKNKRLHSMLNEQIKKSEQQGEELKVIRTNLEKSEKEIARQRLEIKAYKEAMANPSGEPRIEYVTNKPVKTSPADKTAGAATASAVTETPKPASHKIEINRIAGKITSIDDQIIKINIGSLHGLQAGMRLIVYRRDKFVGYLRVDIVGETTAAGAMSRQVYPPQVGDSVVDRL